MAARWPGLCFALLAALVSLWAYPRLPAAVATHRDLSGTPDDLAPRWVAAVLLPLSMLAFWGLAQVLPRIIALMVLIPVVQSYVLWARERGAAR